MKKIAFNKENPVDLFSQLVKVLSKKNVENKLDDSILKLKQLSSEVFQNLKEKQAMSNIEKVADDIIAAAKKHFDLGPGVDGYIKETTDGVGFEIDIKGSFQSGNDIEQTIKDLQEAWKKVDIG